MCCRSDTENGYHVLVALCNMNSNVGLFCISRCNGLRSRTGVSCNGQSLFAAAAWNTRDNVLPDRMEHSR